MMPIRHKICWHGPDLAESGFRLRGLKTKIKLVLRHPLTNLQAPEEASIPLVGKSCFTFSLFWILGFKSGA
jgi:hypothetical protein